MSTRYTDADLKRLQAHLEEHGTNKGFVPTPPRAKARNRESRMQQAIVKWWACQCRAFGVPEHLLMAFPLQAARTAQNGARMKAEGVRKGTPDMFLAVKRGPCAGLWLENKTTEGVVAPEQKAFMQDLFAFGYKVAVCRDFDEARTQIVQYLSLPHV